MHVLKEAVGIDISKDSLAVCFGRIDAEQRISIIAEGTFANTAEGIASLQQWAHTHRQEGVDLWYLMEATGVYYEEVAYGLSNAGARFCVMLPTAVKQFSRSTSVKTKTDRVDARLLCRLALERRLDTWEPATELMQELKALVRERQSLITQQSQVRNRLHALSASHKPSVSHRGRLQQQLRFFASQIREVEQQITEVLHNDDDFRGRIKQLQTIKGLG
ncbi:MAG: transposase [Candidatus Kapaibacterium sp.]